MSIEFLLNAHKKEEKNFQPTWATGTIIEETKTAYIIKAKKGGIYNRIKEDVRLKP